METRERKGRTDLMSRKFRDWKVPRTGNSQGEQDEWRGVARSPTTKGTKSEWKT